MPHERPRYLVSRLQKALKFSSIVGILGQRQVGKTTLLTATAAEYVSLDRERYLLLAESDSEAFLLGHKKPFGIDEAQLSEQLYPALKEHVRLNRSPGQFILTGSVRFTSRKKIRESLTGRIVTLELLPFTIKEIEQKPLPDFLAGLRNVRNEKQLQSLFETNSTKAQDFQQYLKTGGLPGIGFFRDESIRIEKFEAHINTILNRDIRLIYSTTLLYQSLRRLLVYLARNQGNAFRLGEAARESQISTVTVPRVLFAFEALFLIRPMEIRGLGNTTYFLEDQGMASWLRSESGFESRDIVRGLFANLRQEFWYRPQMKGELFQWRTRNGAEVALVTESKAGMTGILPTTDPVPSAKLLRSAGSFLKTYPKAKVVIAYSGKEVRFVSKNQFWIPYWLLV